MQSRGNRTIIATVLGALLLVGLIGGLVVVVNAEDGFATCTGAAEFGWMAPLFAAAIIGGLAWLLLRQDPRPSDDAHAAPFEDCPECGRSVLGQWRMCPYCGEMLDPRYSTRAAASRGEQSGIQ